MTRLEAAKDRLERAIAQLESALTANVDQSDAERESMVETLRAVEAENVALKDAHDSLSRRLDSAIERLKTILEAAPHG